MRFLKHFWPALLYAIGSVIFCVFSEPGQAVTACGVILGANMGMSVAAGIRDYVRSMP